MFGLIEKEVKNKEVIIDPSEYQNIYESYGVVTKLGEGCKVKDWKTYGSEVMKPPAQYHFKFIECKRYYLTRVKNKPGRFSLRGETNYKNDMSVPKSIMKRGVTSMSDFEVRDVPHYLLMCLP